jgi:CRP/FNR family transcriptional regulator, anaerobic regulatory protein
MFLKVDTQLSVTNGKADLPPDHGLRLVASLGRIHTFKRGETLDNVTGQNALIFVKSGTLLVQSLFSDGRRQVLAFRFAGDLLCSAFNHNLPETSAQAVTDLEVYYIPHGSLTEQAGCEPKLTDALIRMTVMQMQRCWAQHLVLGRLNAVERLSSFVLEMALRCGRKVRDGTLVSLPMTRNDIADYLGLNPNVVSRTLTAMRQDQHLIYVSKTELVVPKMERLCGLTPVADGLLDCYCGDRSEVETFGKALLSAPSGPIGCPVRDKYFV